jgi:hypothetical protein
MAKVKRMDRPRARVISMYNECDQITVVVFIQFMYIMYREENNMSRNVVFLYLVSSSLSGTHPEERRYRE